jgi:cell division protein FtsX
MSSSSAIARPHLLGGALAAFVGLSLANTLPPVAQLALYLVGFAAVLQRPHGVLPVREAALVLLAGVYVLVRRTVAGLELDWTMRLLRP